MRTCFILGIAFSLFISQSVFASVVMTGTRIIYPAQAREKSVQLRNTDARPYLVQIEVENDKSNVLTQGDDAFTAVPQIFRMEPNAGQAVRLMYTGRALPQDRESLFYMSFSQLPAVNAAEQNNNQLILAITSRVKIFYRPQGLTDTPEKMAQGMMFSLNGSRITVNNPSPLYASVRRASVFINGREIVLADSEMVAPKSSVQWRPSAPIRSLKGARLRLIVVNDYGTDIVSERIL
ncbi:molecular chaperone [uncultured Pluralibacter sp.]|uniref:fimbrial biogenesis chaperone n=1 Tax=uncultured Pluralibacter sp. TaxID=1490864 RepID=UPI00260B10ED|nr:molecular chaperone [uncultured Pluralibacter sp.]